jgi:hypothetical protein
MSRFIPLAWVVLWAGLVPAVAGEARILKVLPHWLDAQGRHALQPSLYERDAYQAKLRTEPGLAKGLRYDVQWKAPGISADGLVLRLELRAGAGAGAQSTTLEASAKPGWNGRGWCRLKLSDEQFQSLGQVTAWRATLRRGDGEIAEEKSFLW